MRIEDALLKYVIEADITDFKQYYSNEIKDAFVAGFNAARATEEGGQTDKKRRLFRWQRGGLKESLDTTVVVEDFSGVEDVVNRHCEDLGMKGLYYDLSTRFNADDSDRCGDEWKTTFYVIASVKGEGRCVLGYCNFPKE